MTMPTTINNHPHTHPVAPGPLDQQLAELATELEALIRLASGRGGTIPPIIQARAMVALDRITTNLAKHRRAIESAASSSASPRRAKRAPEHIPVHGLRVPKGQSGARR